MRVLVTRPEPDARSEADALIALGHDPVLAPLLRIEFIPDVPLMLDGAQGLIVTSRNALRALADHPERDRALELPLFAVGEATAWAARELGFREVTIGTGTGAGLQPIIHAEVDPHRGLLVHVSAEKVAFDLQSALADDGFELRRAILYRSHAVEELPAAVIGELESGTLSNVLLLSPRTARAFARLSLDYDLVARAQTLVCYCLSRAVAEAVAELGFKIRVPVYPREEDLLALLDAYAAST